MLIKLTNTINSIVRRGLSVVRNGLKMWLPFSKSEVIGGEEVVNGDFSDGLNGWTVTDGGQTVEAITVDGVTQLHVISDGTLCQLTEDFPVGNYELTFNIIAVTGGVFVDNINYSTPGIRTIPFDGGTLLIKRAGACDFNITDISVKEISQFAKDKSPNTNNAKLFTGKALSFDGVNDYVAGLTQLTPTTIRFTLALDSSGSTSEQNILCQDSAPRVGIKVSELATYGNNSWVGFANYTPLFDDVYRTYVLVYNIDGYDLYVDGDYKDHNIDLILPINTISRDGSSKLKGIICNLQMYNSAWTSSDVTFDYNNPNHLVTDNGNVRYGSEEVTNGDFAQGSQGWAITGSDSTHYVEFLSEGARFVSDTTSTVLQLRQEILTPGKFYVATCDIAYTGAGAIRLNVGTNLAPFSEGTNTEYFIATSNSLSFLRDAENVDCVISNVTVKEVTSPNLSNLKGYWALSEGAGDYAYNSAVALGSEEVVNGSFDGVADGADVTTLTNWFVNGTPTSTDVVGEEMVIVAAASGDGARYNLATTVGSTYHLTFNASGDLGASGVNIQSLGDVSTLGGVGRKTFTAVSTTTKIYFRAGNNEAGTTNYDNISAKLVSVGTINGATPVLAQATIPQLGMMDWAKSTVGSDEITFSTST